MIVEIYIGSERLDVFENDGINITQNIQDVSDISKIKADFSQTFSVPASDNNNRIFKHYYNADINNGFDARTNKQGFIMLDGQPFKFGKFRLEGVKMLNGSPKLYRITFFGDAVKLKDQIGDDKLVDLPWLSNFNHDYSGARVAVGLTNGINFIVNGQSNIDYDAGIVYPLISYTKQYIYNSETTDTTNTERLVNIASGGNRTQGVDYSDLKPAIRLKLILTAIEQKYGFNFGGNFFESANFRQLYFALNNSTKKLNAGFVEVYSSQGTAVIEPNYTYLGFRFNIRIKPDVGFTNTNYKLKVYADDNVIYEDANFVTGTTYRQLDFDYGSITYNVRAEIITDTSFEFKVDTELLTFQIGGSFFGLILVNSLADNPFIIDLKANILNLLPDMKVYDLLTSLFKLFNLTVESVNNQLIFQDLQTWYAEGKIYDVTPYVDTRNTEIDRGKVFNQVNFNFEESGQILADQYNQNNGIYFGNIEQSFYEDETRQVQLDGETLDVSVKFEQPVFERIFNQNTNEQTSIQYCPYLDDKAEPTSGKPFLFYVNNVSLAGNNIRFNEEATDYNLTSCLMPSHTIEIDNEQSFAISFDANTSEYTYASMQNNCYSTYYADYLGDIFSSKRRNYKFEAIFPNSLLQKLRLNDRLIIRNRRYIINKIQSNLVNRKDKLELINDIYSAPLASDSINNSVFFPTSKTYNSNAISDSTQYIGLPNRTPALVDTGDGTAWVTIDSFGTGAVNLINFSLADNNTGLDRTAQIQIIDGINNPVFIITQLDGGLNVDSTAVTVDSNLITADNG